MTNLVFTYNFCSTSTTNVPNGYAPRDTFLLYGYAPLVASETDDLAYQTAVDISVDGDSSFLLYQLSAFSRETASTVGTLCWRFGYRKKIATNNEAQITAPLLTSSVERATGIFRAYQGNKVTIATNDRTLQRTITIFFLDP